jgi:hypothetical protein
MARDPDALSILLVFPTFYFTIFLVNPLKKLKLSGVAGTLSFTSRTGSSTFLENPSRRL